MNKYANIFDTSKLHNDLKKRSLRSGAITLSSQGIMFIIQLGSTVILARILSPADYGINAMAVAITGFAGIFSNLGLSTATIQRPEINHNQVSALFWINTSVGLLLTLIVSSLAPMAAWFYQIPEMLGVTLALSTTFIISGLSVQHSALLTRQMRFYAIAKIQIFSMSAGIMVAILLGYYGFGYWSLVFNTLTNVTLTTVGCWFCCRWIPGIPRKDTNVYSMIKFGVDLVGFDVINYFSRNLDNILIGRYYGSDALGIYSKSYQLLMMPITSLRGPITKVAMPALSSLQNDRKKYRNYYLASVSLIAFVSMPLVVFMYVYADQIVALLLGAQWKGVTDIFRILSLAAFIQPVSGTTGMVLITLGRTRTYLSLGVISAVIICSSFVSGLPWGAKGVASAYVIANYVILIPMVYYSLKDTTIGIFDFVLAIYRPLFSSIIMGLVMHSLSFIGADIHIVLSLIIYFFTSTIIYILVFSVFPGGVKDIREYLSYINMIIGKKTRNE